LALRFGLATAFKSSGRFERTPRTSDLLFGVPNIARFVGVSTRQVKYLIESKGLPTFKLGKQLCSTRTGVNRWIQGRLVATASDEAARELVA